MLENSGLLAIRSFQLKAGGGHMRVAPSPPPMKFTDDVIEFLVVWFWVVWCTSDRYAVEY